MHLMHCVNILYNILTILGLVLLHFLCVFSWQLVVVVAELFGSLKGLVQFDLKHVALMRDLQPRLDLELAEVSEA